jgi:uncharacterized protein (TIGR02145 family)
MKMLNKQSFRNRGKSFFRKISIPDAFLLMMVVTLLSFSCGKDEDPQVNIQRDSVYDIDSNVYATVKIGSQWWMAENLEAVHYRDGSPVHQVKSDSLEWANDNAGAYTLYNDDESAPGLLYNWAAVTNTANLAPEGWHIANDEDWKELEKHLGMSQAEADNISWRGGNAGQKLKIESPQGWFAFDDLWATNESGFTAIAGGCRLFNGGWGYPCIFASGFWWTATEVSLDSAYYRYMDYKNGGVFRSGCSKKYGFSIRCVKDNSE